MSTESLDQAPPKGSDEYACVIDALFPMDQVSPVDQGRVTWDFVEVQSVELEQHQNVSHLVLCLLIAEPLQPIEIAISLFFPAID